MRRTVLTVVALALAMPLPARAQEEGPQPKRFTDVEWYAVVHVQYKAGQRDAARELIGEYFAPAGQAAGTPGPAMFLEHQTGRWDHTMVWPMPEGPGDMTWEISPDELKWFGALAELAGGPEKAEEILDKYTSMMQDWTSSVAFQRTDGM